MALVTPAQSMDASRPMTTSELQSTTPLERSASTSSSATAHPLDSNGGQREEKASSSTSSSPTFPSNSSSSNHKTISTISTAISSANTAGSQSPPAAQPKAKLSGKGMAPERRAPSHNSSSDTTNYEESWDSTDALTARTNSSSQARSGSGQRLLGSPLHEDRWNFARYQDDEPYSPIVDEDTPIQYPPVSEDDKEARAIEVNLQRWASEEKQRRKAVRTSKSGSSMGVPAPGKMTKRLSALSILGTNKAAILPLQHKDVDADSNLASSGKLMERDRMPSGDSWGSNGDKEEAVETLTGQVADEEARRAAKGKRRETKDPFRDPSHDPSSLQRRLSARPTARAPIVTPGRAPTVRHRAIERARQSGTVGGQMPSIVATDADEEGEAVKQLQQMDINPFQSAAEVEEQRRVAMAKEAAKTTILEGDQASSGAAGMMPMRKSMSSSKFNEIGLDDESASADWQEDRAAAEQQSKSEGQSTGQRKAWWTEWLCGCGDDADEEGQQSGRTCPD